MTGDPADEMEMPAIDVGLDQRHGYGALLLVGLMLDRHHPVDRLEKLLHVLAFAAAMDMLRRTDAALEHLSGVDKAIGEGEKRLRQ